jgi:hypothetical protein
MRQAVAIHGVGSEVFWSRDDTGGGFVKCLVSETIPIATLYQCQYVVIWTYRFKLIQ